MLLYTSAYVSESSRKRNIIKENIYDEVHIFFMMGCMFLLITEECNFTKNEFLLQNFSNKSSKTDYQ